MLALVDLWMPILVSAVAVFIVSSIVHMWLPIHKSDYKKMPGEEGILETMRGQSVQPGTYMFPCAGSMKDMATPEHLEKCKLGPVGFLTVVPSGVPNMGKSLGQWFAYSILISIFVAYIGGLSLDGNSEFMKKFQVAGAIAVLGYALASMPESIWKGQQWSTTAKFIFDGMLYGLATGLVFAWLWPAAAAA